MKRLPLRISTCILSILIAFGAAQMSHAQQVAATINFGTSTYPNALAVDSARGMLYVALNGLNEVEAIKLSTRTVVATVNLDTTAYPNANPQAIAVSNKTGLVYVGCDGTNNDGPGWVTVINPSNNYSTTTVPVGKYPQTVAVNPVNAKIYVANYGDETVTIINPANSNSTTTVLASSPEPWAFAFASNGTIYVAAAGTFGDDTNLTVINPNTNATTSVPLGILPVSLAVDLNSGNVYVPNYGNGTPGTQTLSVVEPSNNYAVSTINLNSKGPSYIALDGSGIIYLVEPQASSVAVVNPSQNYAITQLPLSVSGPVTYDSGANLIVALNDNTNSVSFIAPGTLSTTTLSVGQLPIALATDSLRSESYIANKTSGSLSIIAD